MPAPGPSGPSCVDDPAADLDSTGTPHAYADIRGACIRPAGASIRLAVTTAAKVPSRMPNRDTTMTVGFELLERAGAESYVYAEADHGGWTAYLTQGNGKRSLPGAVAVSGRTITLTVARAELKGARQLDWNSESSWLSAGLLRTSYAFDTAPDRGHTSFGR